MQRFQPWKVWSILAMSLLAFLVIVPSFLPENTRKSIQSVLPSWIPMKTIVLGLDLQGGAHLVWQVDASDVQRAQAESIRDDVRRLLREERVPLAGGIGASGAISSSAFPTKVRALRYSPACARWRSPAA